MMPDKKISTLYKLLANITICTFIGIPVGFIGMVVAILSMLVIVAFTIVADQFTMTHERSQILLEKMEYTAYRTMYLCFEAPQSWLMRKLAFKI